MLSGFCYELVKLAKRDLPDFVDQDRPAKVKEVYRALEKDHPEYPAELKARIASRKGSSNPEDRKPGPPYDGKLTNYPKLKKKD